MRDNLESIALAVLLVLLVRQLVIEPFQIPTGSMAPALVGVHKEVRCPNCGTPFRVGGDKTGVRGEIICPNCALKWAGAGEIVPLEQRDESVVFQRPEWLWHRGVTDISRRPVSGMDAANRVDRWGSRIFVNRFIYKLRPPRRWELAVFDYPYGDENYIKRIVGLPGESVSIREGNIYINGEIARKPPDIQERMWMQVLDNAMAPREVVEEWWDFGRRPERWESSREEGVLRVDARNEDTPLYARYARPVKDFYAYDGISNVEGRGEANVHPVNEVKIKTDVRVKRSGNGPLFFYLRAGGGGRDFHAEIPAGGGGKAALYDGEEQLMQAPAPDLSKGRKHVLVLERYDKTLVVRIDGQELMRHYYDDSDAADQTVEQFIGVGAKGVEARFDRVRLFRDIYYQPGADDRYVLDDNSYFVLGDNSPYSSDSRKWESPEVPAQNLIGRAFAVFWPISDISFLPAGQAEN